MSEPIRELVFQATVERVTPSAPQPAGVQGEHNATRVSFVLDAGLVRPTYRYRFSYIDGGGGGDSTDFIDIDEGTISVFLPAAWTAAGGCGTLRLCAVELDEENSEEQVVYSLEARLLFASRDDGAPMERRYEKGLSALIAGAHAATGEANTAAENANQAAENANAAAENADAVADEIRAQRDAGVFQGEKGDPGPEGPPGPKGDKGDKGDPGEDGVGAITELSPGMFGMYVNESGHLMLTHNDNEPTPPLSIQDGRLIYTIS